MFNLHWLVDIPRFFESTISVEIKITVWHLAVCVVFLIFHRRMGVPPLVLILNWNSSSPWSVFSFKASSTILRIQSTQNLPGRWGIVVWYNASSSLELPRFFVSKGQRIFCTKYSSRWNAEQCAMIFFAFRWNTCRSLVSFARKVYFF